MTYLMHEHKATGTYYLRLYKIDLQLNFLSLLTYSRNCALFSLLTYPLRNLALGVFFFVFPFFFFKATDKQIMKVIDSCKFRSVLQTALIISRSGSLLNRLNLAVPVWFLSKALLCPILDFFQILSTKIWRWDLTGRAIRHQERLQTRSSLRRASVWGTGSTGESPWRWDVQNPDTHAHTVNHVKTAYAASPHTTLHLLSSPSARLLHCLKWFGRGLGQIVSRLMGSKSRGVMILIAALLPEDRRGW